MGSRKLKTRVSLLLKNENFENEISKIREIPARQVINPLFSLFYDADQLLKWRAVTAMGVVVSHLADTDIESARVIMRRLMWNLNDESGGIGWGSPEAMGDIMARHGRLAEEYHNILFSYIHPQGNYIEHDILQQGVLWGIGRLVNVNPQLLRESADLLCPYLNSSDSELRGLASWSARHYETKMITPMIKERKEDNETFMFYSDGYIVKRTVASFARLPY